jgi:hypothetical protein
MTAGPAHRSLAGRAGWPILILLILAAVAQTLSRLGPQLIRDDLYSGDAQQHVWWLYRFIDPSLFSNDLIQRYYSLPAYSTPGYQVVMRVLVHVLDPQHAAETLAILLALASIGMAACLGFRIGSKTGAAAAMLAFIGLHYELILDGGYPRTFGLFLLLAGALAIYRRRWGWLGLIFAISPVLYAPTVLNLAPAAAVVLVVGIVQHRRLPRGFVTMTALGLVGVGLIAAIYLRPVPAEVGPWFTYNEARKLPEMRPGGRTAFFRRWDTFYFKSPVSGIGLTPTQAAVTAAVLLLLFVWRPKAVPLAAWAILFAALFMFVVAHALLFKLYLPSRYTSYAFPVFAMMAAAAYAREVKLLLVNNSLAIRPWFPRAAVGATGVVFVVVLAMSARNANAMMKLPPYGGITAGHESVLVFLRTLPKETLIAAHPEDANAIPLRAQRSVLANTETSIAFNKNYYFSMRDRIRAIFAMLYATDWQTIDSTADQYGVRAFVLDTTRLTSPDQRPYFRPFGEENASRIEAGKRLGFAMTHPPADRLLFEHGDWVVVRVGSKS